MGETCKILHADSDIVLCVKPSGVLSQDAGEQSMPGLLRSALGTEEIYPVHRLDQAVGGVMVYTRTAEAAAALSRQIQRGAWAKTYLAVVEGTPEAPEGELVDLLYHDQRRNKTYVVTRERRGVKEARLLYRILATEQGRSLVAIRLLTGRTHQIRVQFASRGLPLVGDGRYGARDRQTPMGLWCFALGFPHPKSAAPMIATVPPPDLPPWDGFSRQLLQAVEKGFDNHFVH